MTRLTRLDVSRPLESAQRLQRSIGILQIPDINLHGGTTSTPSNVLDRHLDFVCRLIIIDTTLTRFDYWGSHLELRVRQTVAEGEQGIVEVTVGTTLHRVVLVVGQLRARLVERDGQLTTGVIVAEEYVGNGRAALLTRIPSLDDSVAGLCLW